MTLVLAVHNNNSIVIGSDSFRGNIQNNSKTYNDAKKMYEITNNCYVLVAGNGINNDTVDDFLNSFSCNIKKLKLVNINDIYNKFKDLLCDKFKKDGPRSTNEPLIFILVGFQDSKPKFFKFDSRDGFSEYKDFKIVAGIDDQYVYKELDKSGLVQSTTSKQTEVIVRKVLETTHNKYPNAVDEPYKIKTLRP
jgi:20S proteasome alpha/beta subunit